MNDLSEKRETVEITNGRSYQVSSGQPGALMIRWGQYMVTLSL